MLQQPADRFDAGRVALNLGEALTPRPTPVAVHDDRHVVGQFLERNEVVHIGRGDVTAAGGARATRRVRGGRRVRGAGNGTARH